MRIEKYCPHMVRKELKKHGPVTAIMRVYKDFLAYRSGVYFLRYYLFISLF